MLAGGDEVPAAASNVYSHNFGHDQGEASIAAPEFCYSNNVEGAAGCKFNNTLASSVTLSVKLGEEAREVNASQALQCVNCEDYFHPVCTFDSYGDIDELFAQAKVASGAPFCCNICFEAQEEEIEEVTATAENDTLIAAEEDNHQENENNNNNNNNNNYNNNNNNNKR